MSEVRCVVHGACVCLCVCVCVCGHAGADGQWHWRAQVVTDEMYDGFVRFVKDHFPLASGPFDPALDKLKEALAELGYAEANPDVDLLKQHMAQLTEA
eukprot:296286-Rhodomonas_salina.1